MAIRITPANFMPAKFAPYKTMSRAKKGMRISFYA